MLTQDDINFIKNNREAIKQARTDTVTLTVETVTGEDPYTKEPIITETTKDVQAIVSGFTGQVGGERLLVNGVAIQDGDISITFDYDIDLNGVKLVTHNGVDYTLFSIQPRGIGDPNRYDCVARRVK